MRRFILLAGVRAVKGTSWGHPSATTSHAIDT